MTRKANAFKTAFALVILKKRFLKWLTFKQFAEISVFSFCHFCLIKSCVKIKVKIWLQPALNCSKKNQQKSALTEVSGQTTSAFGFF
jgi:hypothetical protein